LLVEQGGMHRPLPKLLALLLASLFAWWIAGWIAGVAEPWDAPGYWRLWVPLSLGVAALAGAWLGRRGWTAGAVVMLTQLLPVALSRGGDGGLWAAGLLIAVVLAIPAMAFAALAGWLVTRRSG
jgi:hypothetical protein